MRELESFVGGFAAKHGLAAEDQARTLIVLEELLTNLSRYGYPNQPVPEGVVEVTLELEGNRLTIEFGDNGQAFDPLARATPDLNQPVESRPVGGLGLHMVRELSDEVHYSRRNGRNVIRLSRRVSTPRTA
jgi:serine/threonine-protein kinase RsbW